MNGLKLAVAIAGVLLGSGMWTTPAFAQRNTCKDIPIQWVIYETATLPDGTVVPSAIRGDGQAYSGQNTSIHVCGTSPSYDATIVVSNKRKLALTFGAPITGSVVAESIAGGPYYDSPFLNVRNLLCVGCADPTQPFTTRMGTQWRLSGSDYRLRFMPFTTDAPDRHTNPDAIPAENTPFESSPVRVLPQPYDCHVGGKVRPSWVVRGTNTSADPGIAASESLQVGTLTRVTNDDIIHSGQYSLPFEMRIEALSCFTY